MAAQINIAWWMASSFAHSKSQICACLHVCIFSADLRSHNLWTAWNSIPRTNSMNCRDSENRLLWSFAFKPDSQFTRSESITPSDSSTINVTCHFFHPNWLHERKSITVRVALPKLRHIQGKKFVPRSILELKVGSHMASSRTGWLIIACRWMARTGGGICNVDETTTYGFFQFCQTGIVAVEINITWLIAFSFHVCRLYADLWNLTLWIAPVLWHRSRLPYRSTENARNHDSQNWTFIYPIEKQYDKLRTSTTCENRRKSST
jgi:hypothetical protein